jgi:hypothetical protein
MAVCDRKANLAASELPKTAEIFVGREWFCDAADLRLDTPKAIAYRSRLANPERLP